MSTDTPQNRFQSLLDQHRKIVFKVANTYGRTPDDRSDLAQEISAQLWRAFPRYDAGRPFSTWMYRIALNVAISFARRSGLRRARTVAWSEVEDRPDRLVGQVSELDDRVVELQRFIETLDDLNRALLLLYLDEQSYREIAEVLGISETNVATKISRLKQRIRNEFRNADPSERSL